MKTNAIIMRKIDNMNVRIITNDFRVKNKIVKFLSVFITNAQYSPKFQMGIWDGKINYYNMKNNTIPMGLWYEVFKFCRKEKISVTLQNLKPTSNISEKELKSFIDNKDDNKKYKIRNYQFGCISKMMKYGYGNIESATGSGKSYIIYNLMESLFHFKDDVKKMILIVPTINLVIQMYNDLKDYGMKNIDEKVDILNGDIKDSDKKRINNNFDKDILITTWQSIYKKNKDWFSQFDGFVIDEVHLAKSKSLDNIAKKLENAKYRYGCSGTIPEFSEEPFEFNTIIGNIGPIVKKVTAKELMDEGILAKMNINILNLKYPPDFVAKNNKRNYSSEIKEIEKYEDRMKALDYIIENRNGNNIIILNKHIDHLGDTIKYLNKYYSKEFEIEEFHGSIHSSDRERIRNKMDADKIINYKMTTNEGNVFFYDKDSKVKMSNRRRKKSNNIKKGESTFDMDGEVIEKIEEQEIKKTGMIIVASYKTASTGINIKNISDVVFFSPYKSKYTVLQSLGRGLRKTMKKSFVIIWDVVDNISKEYKNGREYSFNYAMKHFLKRLDMYNKQKFDYNTIKIKL